MTLVLRRWGDRARLSFVPHTWRWWQTEGADDTERVSLPRVLAYSVPKEVAYSRYDGMIGLAIPRYAIPYSALSQTMTFDHCRNLDSWKGPWDQRITGIKAQDQVVRTYLFHHNPSTHTRNFDRLSWTHCIRRFLLPTESVLPLTASEPALPYRDSDNPPGRTVYY